MNGNEVKRVKIGVKDIMEVTPGNPRVIPLIDPRQPETVSVMCYRQNRVLPNLPYKFGIKREPSKGVFWIIATPKEDDKNQKKRKV